MFLRFKTAMVGAGFVALALGSSANAMTKTDSPETRNLVAKSSRPAPTKKEVLARLQAIQAKLTTDVAGIDDSIGKRIQESTEIDLNNRDVKLESRKLELITTQLAMLNAKRTEINARRELIDRITFAVDSKWNAQPLSNFFEQQFLDMALTDVTDPRTTRLWKAMIYMSVAVREIPDSHEDVLNVIEGYLSFSNMLDPKTPAEYLASRNYTSGAESQTANGVSRDDIGSLLPADDAPAHGVSRSKIKLRQ